MTRQQKYLITPEHVYELDTQVVHACSLDEATLECTKRYLETGKIWGIYELVAVPTPTLSNDALHKVVTENLRLKTILPESDVLDIEQIR